MREFPHQAMRCRYAASGMRCGKSAAQDGARYLPGLECRTIPCSASRSRCRTPCRTPCRSGMAQAMHAVTLPGVRLLRWRCGRPQCAAQDGWRHALADRQGSVTLELDEAGHVAGREAYYPYGGTAARGVRRAADDWLKTHRHAGQERDATGLMYYGFRYYVPRLGRWASADPAGTVDGLNVFAMARNNPATHTDRLGLYTGMSDAVEADVQRTHGAHAIVSRGMQMIAKDYPDTARQLTDNLRVAERLAHAAAARLRDAALEEPGDGLPGTLEGRSIDWLIGNAHDPGAIELARRAFHQTMRRTANMLTWHRRQNGEQIVLYRGRDEGTVAFVHAYDDPHHRIFINMTRLASAQSRFGGPMVLLHEASHQSNGGARIPRTLDYWYLPILRNAVSPDILVQLSPPLAQNLGKLTDRARFVQRVLDGAGDPAAIARLAGTQRPGEVTDDDVRTAKDLVLDDPMIAARVVPENAPSLTALAVTIGFDVLRYETR